MGARLSSDDRQMTALMANVRQGCQTSFEQLYRITSPRLYRTVLRINPVRPEAEEVLQETYFKVWNERARFDVGKAHVMCWLLAIARNGAIDSLRRHRARPAFVRAPDSDEPGERYGAFASSAPGPSEIAILRQSALAVHSLLEQAPELQRQCLLLAFDEGLSHSEIARRLNRPLGTVKSTLRRALEGLRTELTGHA